ncbi:MAG: AMP nucleosidase [Proteobacteria bacterium]|nr:AMP nucleosidase [Pseudomonadota bacterium]
MTTLPKSPYYPSEEFLEKLQAVQYFDTAEKAVDYIDYLYQQSTSTLSNAFARFLKGEISEEALESPTVTNYPFVALKIDHKDLHVDARLAYGVAVEPGVYGTTVTRPDIFRDYYKEQLHLLIQRHKVQVIVGVSDWPIPLPFVVDHAPVQIDPDQIWQLQRGFVLPNLTRIDDVIANGTYQCPANQPKPLALFSGERVDYSLNRLYHYTGTTSEHFQGFVLLTNYQRYIDEFISFALDQLENGEEYTALIAPGNVFIPNKRFLDREASGEVPKHLPQMPAYHLKREDGQGITFINIGVGPSNAKNITDHLAVLRPHCWLMLGHCAGLRSSQKLGDYILAHGYVRDDHVLDQDLPLWAPVPPIAEVQVAFQQAVTNIFQLRGKDMKTRMRTGTVLTTDNRNWELRSAKMYECFLQSRAIAVDMESATVAANGFRFRVPYGTLLCVSDKPIHGELKLRGMANAFYRQRVTQHLKIGLEAVKILREQGSDQLHSRKLRGFDEPPFR